MDYFGFVYFVLREEFPPGYAFVMSSRNARWMEYMVFILTIAIIALVSGFAPRKSGPFCDFC
jgi:hypothetical protein